MFSSPISGLCIRPEEMTLPVGSHGPTLNVCIAKFTDCPCPIIHCCSPRVRCQTSSITTRTRDASDKDCYIQTRSTPHVHTHTHTHLISSCVHHSKPRGRRSTPLSCAYCTRQHSNGGLGQNCMS